MAEDFTLPPPPDMGDRSPASNELPPPPDMKMADLPPPPDMGDLPPPPDMGTPDSEMQAKEIVGEEIPKGYLKRMFGKEDVSPEQMDKAKGALKFQKEKEMSLSSAWQATKDTAKLAILPFQALQRLTVGNAVRTLRPDLYESLNRAIKMEGENPSKAEVFTKVDQALNQIAPDLYLSQTFVDGMAKGLQDMGVNESVARGAAATTGLAVDILTDPLTYVTFGASVPAKVKAAKVATKEFQEKLAQATLKGESVADILIDKLKKDIPAAKPYAQQMADGDVALVSMKIPFRAPETSKVLIKGDKAAKLWTKAMDNDAVRKVSKAMAPFRLNTGNLRVDDALAKQTMWEAATKMKIAELSTQFGEYTPNVKNIANAIEQYGPQKAKGFLKDVAKIKYSDEEFDAAQNLYNQLREIHDYSAELNQVGKNIVPVLDDAGEISSTQIMDKFKPATTDERLELINELRKKIPDFKEEWLPYAFREQYGLPRRLSKEARKAEQVRLDRGWESVMSDGGKFKMTANVERESSKFSTFVQDLLKGKETGLMASFETDPVKRTLDSIQDMYKTAGNKQFVDEILNHGWTSKQVAKYKELVRDGKSIPQELQGLMSVDVNSLRSLDEQPFNKIRAFAIPTEPAKIGRKIVKLADEVGEDIPREAIDALASPKNYKGGLIRDDFLTTPEVAFAIENRFGPSEKVSQNVALAGIKWYNDQWRRTVLTNPLRLPRESVENMAAYGMARGNPKYLVAAPADIFKYSVDPKKNKADAITTAFFNSPYSEHIGNYDADIWKSAMNMEDVVNYQVQNVPFMQTLHDAAKTGQKEALDDLLGFAPKKSSKLNPLNIVEAITDNKVTRNMRNFVGGAATNAAKLALAKTYHFDHGLPIWEAMRKADQAMVSFVDINSKIKTLRNYSPFISYNIRNIQRLPMLAAASPAGVTFYDKVKQAVSNYNGWTPEDNVVFTNLINGATSADPIIGPLLRGTEAMKDSGDIVSDWVGYIGKKVLGDEGYEKQMKEKQFVSWYLPDPYRSSINFTNPEKGIENLSPIIKATIAAFGVDPFTGKPFAYQGTELQAQIRWAEAADELNPIQYHSLVRLGQAAIRSAAEKYKENLINEGKDPKVVDSEYKSIYGDNFQQRKEKDRKALAASVNWATFGLGTLTNVDFGFMIKQASLAKQAKTLKSDFMKRKYQGRATEAELNKVRSAIDSVRSDIHYNADLMQSFKKALSEGKPFMDSVEKELNKRPPDRKPQSVGPQSMLEKIGNMIIPGAQAMGAGTPRENEIVSRGTELTRKYLKPGKPQPKEEVQLPQQEQDESIDYEDTGKFVYGISNRETDRLFDDYVGRTDDSPGSPAEIREAIEIQKAYEDIESSEEQVRQRIISRGLDPDDFREYLDKLREARKREDKDEAAVELRSWVNQDSPFDEGEE